MIDYVAAQFFLGLGLYLTLLGSKAKLPPVRWQGLDEALLFGRIFLFLGVLSLPPLFGISFHHVGEWLEDIWTTGGGARTG